MSAPLRNALPTQKTLRLLLIVALLLGVSFSANAAVAFTVDMFDAVEVADVDATFDVVLSADLALTSGSFAGYELLTAADAAVGTSTAASTALSGYELVTAMQVEVPLRQRLCESAGGTYEEWETYNPATGQIELNWECRF